MIKRKIQHWNVETIEEFLNYIKDTVIYLPVFIAYIIGLREGEIAALRWKRGYKTLKKLFKGQ